MQPHFPSRLAGVDPDVVEAVLKTHPASGIVSGLRMVALLKLFPVALISVSAGHAAVLAGQGALAGLAVGTFFGVFTINCLRLYSAGGGVAPHLEFPKSPAWHFPPVLTVLLVFLAIFFAQPALLWVFDSALEKDVERHRRSLITMNEVSVLQPLTDQRSELRTALSDASTRRDAAQQRLAQTTRELAEVSGTSQILEDALTDQTHELDEAQALQLSLTNKLASVEREIAAVKGTQLVAYETHVTHARFLLRRLALVWRAPAIGVLLTLLFLALVMLPLLIPRWLYADVLTAYERQRHAHSRAVIRAAYLETQAALTTALRSFSPGYQGRNPTAFVDVDPPFAPQWHAPVPAVARAISQAELIKLLRKS